MAASYSPSLNPRLSGDGTSELTCLTRLGDLDKLFPPSWKAPSSLLEALQEADIPKAEEVAKACYEIAESVCAHDSSVQKEDAAVIACYTFDFGPGAYDLVRTYSLPYFIVSESV